MSLPAFIDSINEPEELCRGVSEIETKLTYNFLAAENKVSIVSSGVTYSTPNYIGRPYSIHELSLLSNPTYDIVGIKCLIPSAILGDVTCGMIERIDGSYSVFERPVPPNPTQKLEVSKKLMVLMKNNAIDLDKNISDKIEELVDSLDEPDDAHETESDYLRTQISNRIEGLLSTIARINEGKKEYVLISESGRLSTHFREEVQKWLDLDNYNLKEVWERLYIELSNFASTPRDRVWGKIAKNESDNIVLFIDPKEEFKIINPKDHDDLA